MPRCLVCICICFCICFPQQAVRSLALRLDHVPLAAIAFAPDGALWAVGGALIDGLPRLRVACALLDAPAGTGPVSSVRRELSSVLLEALQGPPSQAATGELLAEAAAAAAGGVPAGFRKMTSSDAVVRFASTVPILPKL